MSALKKTLVPEGVVGRPARPLPARRSPLSAPSGMLLDLRCDAQSGRRVSVLPHCVFWRWAAKLTALASSCELQGKGQAQGSDSKLLL